MSSGKIIITNKSAILNKYGDKLGRAIFINLDVLIVRDMEKGVNTYVVYVDDEVQMAEFNSHPVTNHLDEKQNKDAIDAIYRSDMPEYILILGGPEIIPFVHLDDPLGGKERIPSDLPYACNKRYSTAVEDFKNPNRKVSRLPDLSIGTAMYDNADLLGYFTSLIMDTALQESQPKENYVNNYFAVSSADLFNAKINTVQKLFGNSDKLINCPDNGMDWTQEQYDCLFHYFALYGSKTAYEWCSKADRLNVVYGFENGTAVLEKGTIVLSQTSFGAYFPMLKHPSDLYKEMPISNTYMKNKAAAFLGSTSEVRNDRTNQNDADKILIEFAKSVMGGNTLGGALLEARLKINDLQVLAQFNLYGDSSFCPVDK